MNRGISPVQSEGLFEPLDIDIDSLDHALMDLLTSDWQTTSMPCAIIIVRGADWSARALPIRRSRKPAGGASPGF